MSCASCVAAIEGRVYRIPGVERINVALLAGSGDVTYLPQETSAEEIMATISKAGFKVHEAPPQDNTVITLKVTNTAAPVDAMEIEVCLERSGCKSTCPMKEIVYNINYSLMHISSYLYNNTFSFSLETNS